MTENPIFIVGTERSGSNLLRLILNEHEDIAIPHPPHLMRDITPLLTSYGDLKADENFRRLVGDAVKLVELHFAPWKLKLDSELIFRSARARDLYCVYAEIYEQYRLTSGKPRWGCKSTFMIRHIDDIIKYHRAPKIIHLIRDGRDVAVSARDSVFNRFHPHYVAELWKSEQQTAMTWQTRLSRQTLLTVRYEDLIAQPEQKTREICAFLDEPYSPQLLKFFESRTAAELAALSASWQNVARPVLASNSGKYRKHLSPADIFEFERVAWRELQHYGYKLDNEATTLTAARPSAAKLVMFYGLEKTRALQIQLQALLSDGNELQRWKKRLYLKKIRWLR